MSELTKYQKKLSVHKNDTVIVVSGDDKGKKGKVVEVSLGEGKVIVEGVNIVTKHVRPRKQGEAGGLIKTEGAFYACKVQLYCSNCDKGVRVKHKTLQDGKKIRICAKCGENL
jgi:ribosomal protein L24, bacterial/organelle